MSTYLFNPPAVQSLAIRGRDERFPVNRLFFVGRNYHAHAVEMGKPVDKSVERPFYFTKAPQTLTPSGATVAYPPETKNYHFEMELVVAIGQAGFSREGRRRPHRDLRLRRRPGHDPARPAAGGP
jgi:fumarylpyruvate hydrolase